MESFEYVSFDVFRRSCPSHTVLETLSNKWLYLVVMGLYRFGRQRYSELQRRLEGVSPKMLSQTLRTLERDGLIRREVFPEVPPRVEYELTPLGRQFSALLGQICNWAQTHVPEILDARTRYDTK